MRKDFKKASFLFAIIVFFFGISALVISSVVNYFSYSDVIVILGEFISFVALILLMAICIFAKSDYNYVCTKFADYILDNRKKEAEHQLNEAQHLKQIQTMKSAAAHEREDAVAAALEQGRNEGAHAALQAIGSRPTPPQDDRQPSAPAPQPQQPQQPQQSQPRQMPSYMQPIMPNDEILYNEYGEPVMIRRRVRRNREHYSGDVLYDRFGNPVARRTQNIWEIGGQKIQVTNQPEASAEPSIPPQTAPQVQAQQQTVVSPPPPTAAVQQTQPAHQTASQPSAPTVQPPTTAQQSEQPLSFSRRTENTENSEPFRYF